VGQSLGDLASPSLALRPFSHPDGRSHLSPLASVLYWMNRTPFRPDLRQPSGGRLYQPMDLIGCKNPLQQIAKVGGGGMGREAGMCVVRQNTCRRGQGFWGLVGLGRRRNAPAAPETVQFFRCTSALMSVGLGWVWKGDLVEHSMGSTSRDNRQSLQAGWGILDW